MSGRQDVCRTCLREDNLIPIFSRGDQIEKYTIALFLTTGLQIELNDGLPQKICRDCRELVRASLRFREQGHDSEQTLLSWGLTRHTVNRQHDEIFKQLCRCINANQINNEEEEDLTIQHLKKEPIDNNVAKEVSLEFEKRNSGVAVSIKDEITPKTEDLHTESFNDYETNASGTGIWVDVQEMPSEEPNTAPSGKRSTNERCWSDDSYEFEEMPEKEKSKEHPRGGSGYWTKLELEKVYGPLLNQPVQGPGAYTCTACKRVLKNWNSFKHHAKLHLAKVIMCEFCGELLTNMTHLSRHLILHHGKARPHRCIHCDHAFSDSTRLMMHVRARHTNERPFVCDVCGAGFANRRHITQHLSRHVTERTVKCPQCPSMFRSKVDVYIHINHVHKKKDKTACIVCHKYRRNMREHMINMHGMVPAGSSVRTLWQKKKKVHAVKVELS